MKWQLVQPQTETQWQAYYQLRYQLLRQPWQQPIGSEKDELEALAYHLMVENAQGEVLAVGRLHPVDQQTGQIRFMAVAHHVQGQGLGLAVLQGLEQQALHIGLTQIQLNARDAALGFYQKAGYLKGAEQAPLFGIAHFKMTKTLRLSGAATQWQPWCEQMQALWHQTIPLSDYMQIQVNHFDGTTLSCSAPLAPNKNLHQTMFAGSINSLMTLTGWGLVYLQLKAAGLSGDIVLAEANIRYLKPVQHTPVATASLLQVQGDLSVLARQRTARQKIQVVLQDADTVVARWTGQFAILPQRSTTV